MNLDILSKRWALVIARESNQPEQEAVIAFGLHLALQFLIKGLWIGLWMLFVTEPIHVLNIAIAFGLSRAIMGGVHAPTFVRCQVWSLGTMGVAWFAAQASSQAYSNDSIAQMSIAFVMTISMIVFIVSKVPIRWGARSYSTRRVLWSKWLAFIWLVTITCGIVIGQAGGFIFQCAVDCFMATFFGMLLNVQPISKWMTKK